jgi:hypothetical protein
MGRLFRVRIIRDWNVVRLRSPFCLSLHVRLLPLAFCTTFMFSYSIEHVRSRTQRSRDERHRPADTYLPYSPCNATLLNFYYVLQY